MRDELGDAQDELAEKTIQYIKSRPDLWPYAREFFDIVEDRESRILYETFIRVNAKNPARSVEFRRIYQETR